MIRKAETERDYGPPILFETMIFESDGAERHPVFDDYMERCATWLEAEAQHETAVAAVERETGLKRSAADPSGSLAQVGGPADAAGKD